MDASKKLWRKIFKEKSAYYQRIGQHIDSDYLRSLVDFDFIIQTDMLNRLENLEKGSIPTTK